MNDPITEQTVKTSPRLRELVWYLATGMALFGVSSIGVDWLPSGQGFLLIGGTALIVLCLVSADVRMQEDDLRPLGGVPLLRGGVVVLFLAGIIVTNVTPLQVSTELRVITLATSLQALLLIMDVRPPGLSRQTRWLPVLGHGAMLTGTVLALDWGPFEPDAALVVYATGSASLILHAFWMRQLADGIPPESDTMTQWEAILLLLLISGLLSVAVVSFVMSPGELLPTSVVGRFAAIVAGSAVVLSLAVLALPPSPPNIIDPLTGTIATVLQHGATVIMLLNILVLAVILLSTQAFYAIIGLFFLWLVLAAVIEYLQAIHARRRKRREVRSPPPLSDNAPVTVIVTAAFEANVLPESLSENLDALGQRVPFIIVPAAKSDDGTVEIAYKFADRNERVRVIEGTSGSKAGDLNQAWSEINTKYAFILDADETIGAETIARGLQTLRERPEVGVVQGRKAATHPDTDAFSRFVSVERQHSTWVDHPFVDAVFGAGHFGGSIAMFRQEVPPEAGGWDPDALTEDIDFTLRMYRETDWIVEYDSEMVGWEYQPASFRALIRQRVRWARGWAQAAARHFGDILQARKKLGLRRTVGIEWLLFTAVSAPLSTIFPVIMIMWYLELAPPLPFSIAVLLAVLLLPARAVSFGYAGFGDPKIPIPATARRVVEVLGYAYLWIVFGWFIQLHALYLQFSGAPRLWYVTEKTSTTTALG